jgi:hypothetical protein
MAGVAKVQMGSQKKYKLQRSGVNVAISLEFSTRSIQTTFFFQHRCNFGVSSTSNLWCIVKGVKAYALRQYNIQRPLPAGIHR